MNDAPFLIRLPSPIGCVEVAGTEAAITRVHIESHEPSPCAGMTERSNPVLERARQQLEQYFAGERTEFDLPVSLHGTTFQREVWSRLARLQWGEHLSYGQLATDIGRGGAARAIGGAVGANPTPLIIGCHRVLAADGRITGYSAGAGVSTKIWLLGHEQITFAA